MSQQTVKEAVLATVEAIRKDAAVAKVRYKARTQWEEDVRCTGRVRDFEPMVIDEPPAFGGGDSAVSPADVVLVALGTCQEIMYVALASAMGIPLQKCQVSLEGDLDVRGLLGMGKDENVPPGFSKVHYKTTIESSASQEQLQQLAAAVDEQCPVLDMLVRSVDVSKEVIINSTDSKAA